VALANDSSGFMGTYGLELIRSEAIAIRSEDLFVSADKVAVDYVFHNESDQPITTTVVFPFPDIDLSISPTEANWDFPAESGAGSNAEFLGFTVTAGGTPVATALETRAWFKGREVTAQVQEAGLLTLSPWSSRDAARQIAARPADIRARLVRAGLLAPGEDSETDPQWTIRLKAYWTQTFPPHANLPITHRYHPFVGAALLSAPSQVDGRTPLARLWAKQPATADRYCIDGGTRNGLAALERRGQKESAGAGGATFSSLEIEYILTTARNWQGPIGQFRLTLDKGRPENIVSLCWPGIKKISPTAFRFEATNWRPDRDLKMIIFQAWRDEGAGR